MSIGNQSGSDLGMVYTDLESKSAEMRIRVANMVTQSFAAAPGAAKAVAGANRTYYSTLMMMANFLQTAIAIKDLTKQAGEHGKLMETTSQSVQQSDDMRARKEFNADTLLPPKRNPGSTNV